MNCKTVTYQAPEVDVILLVPETALLSASTPGGTEDLDLDFVDDLGW